MIAVGLLLVAGACGDEETSSPETSAPNLAATSVATSAVATTAPALPATTAPGSPPTTAGATTAPATAPASTAPPTTAGPATTPPAVGPGWETSDFVPAASVQGYSGNWWGEGDARSPAAPTDPSAPPADGYYVATLLTPWKPGDTTLRVKVQRLDLCTALPAGSCNESDDPSELGLDPAWSRELDVPLDAGTNVVVTGYKCGEGREVKSASGSELVDLFEAYTADYQAAVAPLLETADNPWDVGQVVAAAPSGGFVGEADMCGDAMVMAGYLRYVHDDAPVLLLQTVTDWDGGPLDATDLIGLQGVQYEAGVPTFYFYAGFYS